MKKPLYIAAVVIAICSALSSCVTKGKYEISQSWVHKLEGDSAATHRDLYTCNGKVKSLQDDKAGLESQLNSAQGDLDKVTTKSKMTIAEQAKRLKDLQDLIQSQRDVMNKLRKSIADALINFNPDELSVSIRDGKIYVSLQEKLLFKSGSAVVDPKGKEALGTLAAVLNAAQDININIEGHTDSVPIKNQKFEDNWALSVGRSTAIARILINDYNVDPRRMTASGRSKYYPVMTNLTDEGRSSNRRTEIIISPNLSELYKLLDM